jgi:ATP-dependent DNA helicase RecG
MLTRTELEALAAELESDRVERKASLSDPAKVRQAICAFANDLPDHQAPGIVLVGMKDDGTCANLPITDDLMLTIAAMRDDGNIQPFPIMSVQKMTLSGCEVAVIEVQPAYNPPVRLNGRAWIRVGPRRATASAEEERGLTEKRRAGNLPFDQQPVMGATLADLDLDLFRSEYLPAAVAPDVLEENDRTLEQQLASLRFLTKEGMPNNAAILVFGLDPLRWLPGAYVQFLRLDGCELTDPIRHQKEMSGPLSQVVRQLDEVLDANISVATNVATAVTEVRSPDYPIVALQQLTRNAVMHRVYEGTNAPSRVNWFADRIEILSPGGPYGQVNASNFGQPGVTDYRNPLVAEAMKVLGYVQRFGLGIALAQREMKRNGSPPIEFQVTGNAVLAILRRRP